MDVAASKALPAYGFITVLASADHGLFGGYLVLSPQGRPLEFRCTTPVAPSRAQQILYGPTLRAYLLSEVIGQALLAGSEIPVLAILTDESDMAALALLRSEPVLHVERAADSVPAGAGPAEVAAPGGSIALGLCHVNLSSWATSTVPDVRAMLTPLAAHIDLLEPFSRIRAALTEAQLASTEFAEPADDRCAAA